MIRHPPYHDHNLQPDLCLSCSPRLDTNGIRAALWALIAGQLGYIPQGDTTSGLAKAFAGYNPELFSA